MPYNVTYPYNITELQNASTVIDLVKYGNKVTDYSFVSGLMIALFFIMLFSFRKYGIERAIPSASFLCLLLSLLLNSAHILSFYYPIVFGVLMILSGMYLWIKQD
jgi:hypothetical protein